MKNKGFTLIELLAVIVILAIIALIAIPIVIKIIDTTKESATLRSAELYLNAAELAVAKESMNPEFPQGSVTCEMISSTSKTIPSKYSQYDNDDLLCFPDGATTDNGDWHVVTIDVKGEVPEGGIIHFIDGKLDPTGTSLLMSGEKTYAYADNKWGLSPSNNSSGGATGPIMQVKHGDAVFADLTSIEDVYYGDIVSIEKGESTEQFYVIGSKSGDTTKIASASEINGANTKVTAGHTKLILLAMYNLKLDGSEQDITGANNGTTFSSTNYWSSETNYPADLSDEISYPVPEGETSIITIAKAYGSSLGGSGRLLTFNEIIALGGQPSGNRYSTSNCPSFINTHIFWLGSASSASNVWGVLGLTGVMGSGLISATAFGVRPVVEISIS